MSFLQDLGAAFLPSLRGLSGLQLLRHLEFNTWARGTPTDEAILLPTPARFAALQSYTYLNEYAHEVLQASDVDRKAALLPHLPSRR